MDKERLLVVLKHPRTEYLIELLKEYCLEMGKPLNMTLVFLNLVVQTPFFHECYDIAINYYKNKFNVTDLIDNKTNQIILTY